jgi:Domain of unknown function (DUF4351)
MMGLLYLTHVDIPILRLFTPNRLNWHMNYTNLWRTRNDIVEVCIKHFQYLAEKSGTSLSEQEENFMKTMQEIDTIYRAEMSRAKQEGQQEGKVDLILHLLNRRVGTVSIDLQDRVRAVSLDHLKNLGEDLMDFSQAANLVDWLDRHGV